MNSEIGFYKKNGYLYLNEFFPKEKIEAIRTDAKDIFLKQFMAKGYIANAASKAIDPQEFNGFLFRLFNEDFECLSNCGKQAQHLISLHSLSVSSKVVKLLKSVGLKTPIISTRPVLYFNHPNLAKEKVFYKVDPHQDWRSMQGSINSTVIWIPLMNITKELGALQILPGSHLKGLRTDHVENGFGMVLLDDVETKNFISIEVKMGDALIFSSFLIHQSGENITGEPRWSCHFRYNDLNDPSFIERKFAHPYIYKPMEGLITKDFPSIFELAKIFS